MKRRPQRALKGFTNVTYILVKVAKEEAESKLCWTRCWCGRDASPQEGRTWSSGPWSQILRQKRGRGASSFSLHPPSLCSAACCCQSLGNSLWSTWAFCYSTPPDSGVVPMSPWKLWFPSALVSSLGFHLVCGHCHSVIFSDECVKAERVAVRFPFKKTTFQEWIHVSFNKNMLNCFCREALAYRYIQISESVLTSRTSPSQRTRSSLCHS